MCVLNTEELLFTKMFSAGCVTPLIVGISCLKQDPDDVDTPAENINQQYAAIRSAHNAIRQATNRPA